MHDTHDIPYGVPVTVDPRRRYLAGRFIETDDPVTLIWDARLEEAVSDGQARVISVGETTEVGDLELSEYQDLRWDPDPHGPNADAENGTVSYDPSAENVTINPGVDAPHGSFDSAEAETFSTEEGRITDTQTVTVNVPSDFDTIDAALNDLAELYRPRGVEYEINIESGHAVTEGFHIQTGYYGHISIVSEDDVVPVSADHVDTEDLFYVAHNAVGPIIDALFDGQGNIRSGINVTRNSSIYVTSGSGVRNATDRGLFVQRASSACAIGADFSESEFRAVQVYRGSQVAFTMGDASNCGGDLAVRAVRGSFLEASEADISGANNVAAQANRTSGVVLRQADLRNAGGNTIEASRTGFIEARGADFRGATDNAIDCNDFGYVNADNATISDASNPVQGAAIAPSNRSVVSAREATASNVGGNLVDARDGSVVNITNAIGTDSTGTAVRAMNGATVTLHESDLSGAGSTCLSVGHGSRVDAQNANMSGAGSTAIHAFAGSEISADGADVTNAGTHGAWAEGSTITLTGADVSGANNSTELRITAGGTIRAEGCQTTNGDTDQPHENDLNWPNEFNTHSSGRGTVFAENFTSAS